MTSPSVSRPGHPATSLELDEYVAFARRLAMASAQIIRQYFRADLQVELKEDLSPVTIADTQAEAVMREMIMERFPEHGILGEEFGHYQPDAPYQWVLDPIDGTKSFISGSYLFGTLIALVVEGSPRLGVIHHPILDDFLVGDGRQTLLNGRPVHVRPCDRIEDAVLLNTSHWNVFNYQNGPAFEALSKRVKRYHNWGDCHGYYLVAIGGADIMTDPVLNPWDLMALIPIIEGAGGRITDWHGNDPLQGDGIVATGGTIHDEVIRWLNP
ncbi:histidinol-phosphatase [Litorilinea aerophila]|nr:histidinol-phosphatase [Litorilinea aerophila]MCC9075354.1 histidinol-phosphatase [Litorilinea aerophila]